MPGPITVAVADEWLAAIRRKGEAFDYGARRFLAALEQPDLFVAYLGAFVSRVS